MAPTPLQTLDSLPLSAEDAARLRGRNLAAYGQLAEELRRTGAWGRAHAVLREGSKRFCSPELYGQLLYLHRGSLPLVQELLAQMRLVGVPRDARGHVAVLEAHLLAQDWAGAAASLAPAWSGEVALPASAWRLGADGFAAGQQWCWSADCVDQMQRAGLLEEPTKLLGLAKALAGAGDAVRAARYLAELQERGLRPSANAFGHLLVHACARGDLLGATDVLLQARRSGRSPQPADWGTWTTLLGRAGHPPTSAGRLDDASGHERSLGPLLFGTAAAIYLRAGALDRLAACLGQAEAEGVAIEEPVALASLDAFAAAGRAQDTASCWRSLARTQAAAAAAAAAQMAYEADAEPTKPTA